jgi:hypothetical protein
MADLDSIARRPAAYLAETGVPQLTSGLIFFFLGSSVLIQRLLPRTNLYKPAVPWIGICCAIAVLLAIAAIKRKMVFPRGGYVVPLGGTQRSPSFFLAVLLTVAVAIWFAHASPGRRFDLLENRLFWPGLAIVFAVMRLFPGPQHKSASAICFGVYLACLAPLLWWLPVTTHEQGAYLQVAAGAPLAVAGAVRLSRFFRTNPMPPEPLDE